MSRDQFAGGIDMPRAVLVRIVIMAGLLVGLGYGGWLAAQDPGVRGFVELHGQELWNLLFNIDSSLGLYINGGIIGLFGLGLLGLALAAVQIYWNYAFLACAQG